MKKCIVCKQQKREKHSASCEDCSGITFVSTLRPIGKTNLVIDFPSRENGSSSVIIASLYDLKKHDSFNGDNGITIFNKENSFFEEELKSFFNTFEADNFTKEQNIEIRKEINEWIDSLPDELSDVFYNTIEKNINAQLKFNKKRKKLNYK
jgi:hypothetical protein